MRDGNKKSGRVALKTDPNQRQLVWIAPKRESGSLVPLAESASVKRQKVSEIEDKNNEVIVILSDDDDDDNVGLKSNNNVADIDNDDDVVIVDPSSIKDDVQPIQEDLNDEVQAVGEKNAVHLPHLRQHCTKFQFTQDFGRDFISARTTAERDKIRKAGDLNKKYCDLCYCFVCDKPVSECNQWSMNIGLLDSHCHASDKGIYSSHYKRLRESMKHGKAVTPSPPLRTGTSLATLNNGVTMGDPYALFTTPPPVTNYTKNLLYQLGAGPFKPDNEEAKTATHLTKCRKCGWYNAFEHRNYTKELNTYEKRKTYVTGASDWCHACGRIASEKDFEKEQSKPYKPQVGDVSLGMKVIPFTIKARDPRKLGSVAKYWEENEGTPGWVYDEAEMEHDFFLHVIGKRPTMRYILQSIPVKKKDCIPETGKIHRSYTVDDDPSATEADALLLDDQDHLKLLRELWAMVSDGYDETGLRISASWNQTERKGEIKITLYLMKGSFVQNVSNFTRQACRKALFARLLGCWYNVFPFKLCELTNGMRAKLFKKSDVDRMLTSGGTGLKPKGLSAQQRLDLAKVFLNEEAVRAYNNDAGEVSKDFSLYASGRADDCGVVASSDVSFAATLKNIVASSLVDDFFHKSRDYHYRDYLGTSAIADQLGIASTHRDMRSSSMLSYGAGLRPCHGFTSYLNASEHCLLDNLKDGFHNINRRCMTINGVLQQLENLGHAPADQVDGLNVELFDFQREAVGWALEREQIGGVEKFLWTKLPKQCLQVTADPKAPIRVQLYYSPVLDLFRIGAPPDVRGGFIAAQMGLGKTVISLSLVLLNPAPALPASGTPAHELSVKKASEVDDPILTPNAGESSSSNNSDRNAISWPPPPKVMTGVPKKRGSILSRGTLVVCNVSLVGQWIDEAKSKLKDPGLVYSYHGQNRTRNAMVLAKNAVVVTTYAVLQSDANHHAKKSKDPNYCAPCEQVRWWRIICDESHTVRDATTKNFKALGTLSAVNKWCVTGTPMNTTPLDLKSQLNFIGISYIDKIFYLFDECMQALFKGNHRRRNRWDPYENDAVGPFLFFMQNVMIRHSLSQTTRSSNVGIMTLPPKEEKIVDIVFSENERKEYDRIQEKAIELYNKVKAAGDVNRQYLRLTSALLPLRLACSGGQLEEGQMKCKHPLKAEVTGEEFQFDLDDGAECSICLQTIEEPFATKCIPVPHIFCKECIEGVFSGAESKPCPCCRNVVKLSEMRHVIPVASKNADADPTNASDNPTKKRQKKLLDDSDILFRSKFERLLKELIKIRDEEPESKSLVFSQFSSTLQWMKQELPKHGFQFRTLSGDMSMKKRADALRAFQNDPPTTIFLLSMRSGAVGINLTQANRVFLMEPAMNPALEAQAIGRIYRLGQRKPVTVVKFVVQNSFESRLIKILKRKYGNVSKPKPLETDKAVDKTSEDTKEACPNTSVSGANLGHMKSDKVEMMTEEFDAMFGITEPEDIPICNRSESSVTNECSKSYSGSFNRSYSDSDVDADFDQNESGYESEDRSENCTIS